MMDHRYELFGEAGVGNIQDIMNMYLSIQKTDLHRYLELL